MHPTPTPTPTPTTHLKLLAYHSDPGIKAMRLARVAEHRRLDQVTQGLSWEEDLQRGCAIGCTMHSYSHQDYETELGIPEALAWIEDDLFESMSIENAKEWPLAFLTAIPVGADLSMVAENLLLWALKDVLADPDLPSSLGSALVVSVALIERSMDGDEPTRKEWISNEESLAGAWAGAGAWARSWAWAGARARSWAWAGAWAWSGTQARARAWAWARSWARAPAWSGARDGEEHALRCSKKLLELLSAARLLSGGE